MYSAIMSRFSSYRQCWPKIMTHSNMLKSFILKLRIWTDKYWHGNVHTTVCLNSVFHNQLLSDTWQATILLPRHLPMPHVPALSPWSGSVLGTPSALMCLSATQISPALKHVSDPRMQKYKLLILLGCCPHPFKIFLWHVSNFFRLLKKNRIVSWEVLFKYPSPRETFGKCTCLLSKYQISFEVCG